MKGLVLESRRFYLVVMMLVLLATFLDTIFVCQERDVILSKSSMEHMVEQTILEENGIVTLQNQCISLQDVAVDKGCSATLMNHWVTLIGIALLLLVKEVAYADVRTQEFRLTWPVKKWMREIYDYFAMLVTIVLGLSVQTISLFVVQMRHNHLLLEVLQHNSITSNMQSVMQSANKELLLSMFCYTLVIVVAYTWMYLGMSVTKNALVGIILSVIVRLSIMYSLMTVVWNIVAGIVMNMTPDEYWRIDDIASILSETPFLILSISDFFREYNSNLNTVIVTTMYDTVDYSFTVGHWIVAQVVLLGLLIGGIILSARKKELSKGKLFFFPMLDLPFAMITGCGLFLSVVENLWWNVPVYSLPIMVGIMIVMYVLIHPFARKHSQRLEVK